MANHTVPSINHRTISEGAIPEGAIPLERLQDRIERLEEDLDHEAGHRHLAKEDLAALNVRAERLRASIRGLRADYRDMDRLAARLSCVAVAGWAVAALLALIMVAS